MSTPTCEEVPLQIEGLELRDEAGISDLMSLIGPNLPRVEGMVSRWTTADPRTTR